MSQERSGMDLLAHCYDPDGVFRAPHEDVRSALAAAHESGVQEGLDIRDDLRQQLAGAVEEIGRIEADLREAVSSGDGEWIARQAQATMDALDSLLLGGR